MPLLLALSFFPAPPFTPTARYDLREVRGFAVLVHPDVERHPADAKAALAELGAQLARINRVVPAKPLSALRGVPIWVEWEAKRGGAAEFHVSPGWLKENGYNPEKVRSVEISNARNFVRWSRQDQPWMVLHELAHAYHFRVLGDRHAPLRAAYRQAVERKLYERVTHADGRTRRAYALTDPAEYFAELSEAYFGRNDFEPFTRAELEKHDPVGFALMKAVWGDPRE